MKQSIKIFLHAGYWLLYLALLLLFFFLLAVAQKPVILNGYGLLKWSKLMIGIAIIPGIISFYANYCFLFAGYLQKKRYFGVVILTILVAKGAALIGILILSLLVNTNFISADGESGFIVMFGILTFVGLVNGVIGLVIKGFITWYEETTIHEALQKKNLEMELSLIKSQLDPHFLFNTINNIDVLIERDPKMASDYLNKLSDIIRFIVYETKSDRITLEKELAYIEKYIGLQKIRTSRPDSIEFSVKGKIKGVEIAPILYMPFIENACKHFSGNADGFIRISLVIDDGMINFTCINSTDISKPDPSGPGGLGRDLVEKRLDLLYPGNHTITYKADAGQYSVNLMIKLCA